jgi:hypothetical protein
MGEFLGLFGTALVTMTQALMEAHSDIAVLVLLAAVRMRVGVEDALF